ncbi:hypothetical protein GCM10008018_26150 [Paenibacillus marchantiophytorum]|uniref:SLH domain-containing protein n=1 Tax=Paenibacillus marchantiophytorum TaxID=1619310 RepID=A0ABQ1EN16_9BACL|nr:S-layer homology domain-containing protein [Paenibacillus marchantiophytorum]GFZ79445.1 hypothetical protein GCM10008018_26150 [Paenibacillus marchantiophytorum]
MGLRKWGTRCLALLILLTMNLPFASAATEVDKQPVYTLSVSNDTPSKGDTVEVLIKGSHLKDLYAFEINLDVDATTLKLIEAKTEVSGFSVGPIQKENHIQLAHTRVGQVKGIDGDQILYKVKFEAIRYGQVELRISKVKTVDSALASATLQIDAKHNFTIKSPYLFDDLDNYEWAIKAIEALAKAGIVTGTSDRMFSPEASITRADFVVLLMRTLKLKGEAGQSFDDVQDGLYYTTALAQARGLDIVQGDESNNFRPKASITREDMMVLTDRALRAAQLSLATSESVLDDFNDASIISDYAIGSVAILVKLGLIQGYDQGIHPKETSNRAQAAMLIQNLLAYVEQKR